MCNGAHPNGALKWEKLFNANILCAEWPIDWSPRFCPKHKNIVAAVEYFI